MRELWGVQMGIGGLSELETLRFAALGCAYGEL